MNTTTVLRPEDRQRSGRDSASGMPWADTLPACFRSEAFAEDLDGPDEAAAAPAAAVVGSRPLRRLALSTALAWGILPGLAGR